MKRRPKSRIALILVIAALLLTALWLWRARTPSSPPGQPAANVPSTSAQTPSQTIRLMATGDSIPHEAITLRAKQTDGTYNYHPVFEEISRYFQSADIRFCNQEAPSAGEKYGISGYPSFNAPKAFANDLSATGCNLISLANNHANDKGQAAINETRAHWETLKPLAVSGANRSVSERQAVSYFTLKGVKFAFVAYVEYSNNNALVDYGLNILRKELVTAHLTEAHKQAEVVIVSVHWGSEYDSKENAAQRQWAKTFAELGADIVIGTGPHVLQPVERIAANGQETLVWYSLGNFINAQLDIESLIGGIAVMDIEVDSKKISTVKFLPLYMHYEWTAEQKAREDLLARRNFKLYPLDQATGPLSRSLHQTTAEAQRQRVKEVLNRLTSVELITSNSLN